MGSGRGAREPRLRRVLVRAARGGEDPSDLSLASLKRAKHYDGTLDTVRRSIAVPQVVEPEAGLEDEEMAPAVP